MQEGEETRESWESILAGLAELCNGLAPGLDVPDEQAASLDIFDADDLVMLLERACSPEGRAAVLAVAAALPGSCAAAAVRERSVLAAQQNQKLDRKISLKHSYYKLQARCPEILTVA